MENKQVTKRGLSAWMEDFINGLAKKADSNTPKEEETEEEVVAQINVNDLDKVVWKDETFRVAFDAAGANVINEFGNTVTSIPGAKSVEEVDHKLNSNEIVAYQEGEEEDLSEELDKIALSLEDEDEYVEDDVAASVEEVGCEACDKAEEVKKPEDSEEPEVKKAGVDEDEGETLEGGEDVINVIASGFEELEATIASLEKRLSSIEQQYARIPQLQDVSTTAPEEEVKHFTDSANQTAQEIAKDQAADLTSPAGRVGLSQGDNATAPSETEIIVTNDDLKTPETTEVEAPKAEETEEVKEEKPEEKEDTCEGCGKPASECDCEDCECEENPEVEKLSGAAEKIFQKGICPETGEELVKSRTAGHFMGVYSPTGGTEYAVDLRTGEIYKRKQ